MAHFCACLLLMQMPVLCRLYGNSRTCCMQSMRHSELPTADRRRQCHPLCRAIKPRLLSQCSLHVGLDYNHTVRSCTDTARTMMPQSKPASSALTMAQLPAQTLNLNPNP